MTAGLRTLISPLQVSTGRRIKLTEGQTAVLLRNGAFFSTIRNRYHGRWNADVPFTGELSGFTFDLRRVTHVTTLRSVSVINPVQGEPSPALVDLQISALVSLAVGENEVERLVGLVRNYRLAATDVGASLEQEFQSAIRKAIGKYTYDQLLSANLDTHSLMKSASSRFVRVVGIDAVQVITPDAAIQESRAAARQRMLERDKLAFERQKRLFESITQSEVERQQLLAKKELSGELGIPLTMLDAQIGKQALEWLKPLMERSQSQAALRAEVTKELLANAAQVDVLAHRLGLTKDDILAFVHEVDTFDPTSMMRFLTVGSAGDRTDVRPPSSIPGFRVLPEPGSKAGGRTAPGSRLVRIHSREDHESGRDAREVLGPLLRTEFRLARVFEDLRPDVDVAGCCVLADMPAPNDSGGTAIFVVGGRNRGTLSDPPDDDWEDDLRLMLNVDRVVILSLSGTTEECLSTWAAEISNSSVSIEVDRLDGDLLKASVMMAQPVADEAKIVHVARSLLVSLLHVNSIELVPGPSQ